MNDDIAPAIAGARSTASAAHTTHVLHQTLAYHPAADESWSFLIAKHAMLTACGFTVSIDRYPGGLEGVLQRLVLRWIPEKESRIKSVSSREYVLEISLAANLVPRCIFVGCGLDSRFTTRHAGNDLHSSLEEWFDGFVLASRRMHFTYFNLAASVLV